MSADKAATEAWKNANEAWKKWYAEQKYSEPTLNDAFIAAWRARALADCNIVDGSYDCGSGENAADMIREDVGITKREYRDYLNMLARDRKDAGIE